MVLGSKATPIYITILSPDQESSLLDLEQPECGTCGVRHVSGRHDGGVSKYAVTEQLGRERERRDRQAGDAEWINHDNVVTSQFSNIECTAVSAQLLAV